MTSKLTGPLTAADRRSIGRVHEVLELNGTSAEIVDSTGERIAIPKPLLAVMLEASEHLGRGQSVSVIEADKELTTQQAADLLNVSRPYLVRLLDSGVLKCGRVGSHRRIALDDVLKYREERSKLQRELIGEMARDAQEHGMHEA